MFWTAGLQQGATPSSPSLTRILFTTQTGQTDAPYCMQNLEVCGLINLYKTAISMPKAAFLLIVGFTADMKGGPSSVDVCIWVCVCVWVQAH